jgi:hypothetical protein
MYVISTDEHRYCTVTRTIAEKLKKREKRRKRGCWKNTKHPILLDGYIYYLFLLFLLKLFLNLQVLLNVTIDTTGLSEAVTSAENKYNTEISMCHSYLCQHSIISYELD